MQAVGGNVYLSFTSVSSHIALLSFQTEFHDKLIEGTSLYAHVTAQFLVRH